MPADGSYYLRNVAEPSYCFGGRTIWGEGRNTSTSNNSPHESMPTM